MLIRFYTISESDERTDARTDKQTDGPTDRIATATQYQKVFLNCKLGQDRQ